VSRVSRVSRARRPLSRYKNEGKIDTRRTAIDPCGYKTDSLVHALAFGRGGEGRRILRRGFSGQLGKHGDALMAEASRAGALFLGP